MHILLVFSLVQNTDHVDEIYHDKGAEPPIDHLESIEGVAVLHLDSSELVKREKCSLLPSHSRPQ